MTKEPKENATEKYNEQKLLYKMKWNICAH